MIALIFDLETNGLPIGKNPAIHDVDKWPRCIELAWQTVDMNDGEIISDNVFLIKPDGWVIPKEKFWIDNGFLTEKNTEEGHPMDRVLDLFITDMNSADIIVAHNLQFDHSVLCAEMIRYGKKAEKAERKKVCTMQSSIQYCKIPFGNDFRKWKNHGQNYKYPKLEELYKLLFTKSFAGAHAASADVQACKECFIELVNRKIILL